MLLKTKPHSNTWITKNKTEDFLGNEMNCREQYYDVVLSCDTLTEPGTAPVITGHTV